MTLRMDGPGFSPREWIAGDEPRRSSGTGQGEARPWLGVYFACNGSYVRVYRSADGSGYSARCPRCAKTVNFAVGPGGTGQRFFQVRC